MCPKCNKQNISTSSERGRTRYVCRDCGFVWYKDDDLELFGRWCQ